MKNIFLIVLLLISFINIAAMEENQIIKWEIGYQEINTLVNEYKLNPIASNIAKMLIHEQSILVHKLLGKIKITEKHTPHDRAPSKYPTGKFSNTGKYLAIHSSLENNGDDLFLYNSQDMSEAPLGFKCISVPGLSFSSNDEKLAILNGVEASLTHKNLSIFSLPNGKNITIQVDKTAHDIA